MTRRRLSARERETLYRDECHAALVAGRGEYPICKLCDFPVMPGQLWHANHESHKPRWLGGMIDGISHARCNRLHNNTHDTPLYAKNERVRRRHLDLVRSDSPLPGGRHDRLKKKLNGRVVERHAR